MSELNPVLSCYPADCRPSRIDALGCAGGLSGAQFWRITAPRGALVLRRWPKEHPSPQRLHFIHSVLQHAAQRGITFLPLPISTRDKQTFVAHAGHLWELAPWLSGSADYARSPTAEKLSAAMRALAQFHLATEDFPVDASAIRASAPARHFARLRELARSDVDALSQSITDVVWPDLELLARRFLAALPAAVPRAMNQLERLINAALPLQPCIRDIWHDHVLFTSDRVSGLIDFGALDIDTPATDIARLLSSLVGDDATGWQTGLAAYSAIRPLTQQESLAARALDASGTILAGSNWIRWIYTDHRQFENPAHVVERFRRITARLNALESRSDDFA